jgi:hypothetical protein
MLTWHFGKHKKTVQNTRILMLALTALFIEEKGQNGDALTTTETGSNILIKYIKKGLSHKINKNNIYVSKIIFKL